MKNRRVVRAKRGGGALSGSTAAPAASSAANPFAGVSLTSAAANPFAGVNLSAAPQTNPFAQVTLAKPVNRRSTASRLHCAISASFADHHGFGRRQRQRLSA